MSNTELTIIIIVLMSTLIFLSFLLVDYSSREHYKYRLVKIKGDLVLQRGYRASGGIYIYTALCKVEDEKEAAWRVKHKKFDNINVIKEFD